MSGVLGLDMSYTRSGLVWIEGVPGAPYNVQSSTVSIKTQDLKRWLHGFQKLYAAIEAFERPDFAVIEQAFIPHGTAFRSHAVTVMMVELNGLVKLALNLLDIRWYEPSATEVKKWMTTNGKAKKFEVAEELKRRFGIEFEGDAKLGFDLSDACSLACWGMANGR